MSPPDGVNRGKIKNIETHPGDVGQKGLAVLERSRPSLPGGAGAGKHFVPGTEPGLDRLHHDPELALVDSGPFLLRGPLCRGGKTLIQGRIDAGGFFAGGTKDLHRLLERSCILLRCFGDQVLQELRPDQKVNGNALTRRDLLGQALAPGEKPVDPGLNRIGIDPRSLHGESPLPAVVESLPHGDFDPLGNPFPAIKEPRRQDVVAVGKNVRFHGHGFPLHPLYGKPSPVDFGLHRFDDHSLAALIHGL